MMSEDTTPLLERIAAALERIAPPAPVTSSLTSADAFVWEPVTAPLRPVHHVARVELELLCGIDQVAGICWTIHAASPRGCRPTTPCSGVPVAWARARWSRRRMRPSTRTAACAGTDRDPPRGHRQPAAAAAPAGRQAPLSAVLRRPFIRPGRDILQVAEGGAGGRDRRPAGQCALLCHLEPAPPDAAPDDRERALDRDQSGEAVEEKVSLSDRFGLWLGFHSCNQETYLEMIERYAAHLGLDGDLEQRRREALEWAQTRGSRSGRVAWQFVQDLAGRLGRQLVG